MHQSVMAKKIKNQYGTAAAAKYLIKKGWPFYLTMFVITGKWVL